jgi:NAD(P)H dehydrogenase (quinone)
MIVVTGATGKLGRDVVKGLLKKVDAAQIIAAVRSPEKADDLARLGVQVRVADYSKPETLTSAFAGARKVLLISSSEIGIRIPQHQAVIDAAKAAGVERFVYTSFLRADSSILELAKEHKITEANIVASGLPFVILRNGWYLENHTEGLGAALQYGAVIGTAGEGRFASAARSDFAEAAVTALTGNGHEGKVYELAGDLSFTLGELAAEVGKQAGKPVVYNNLSPEALRKAYLGFGLPDMLTGFLIDSDLGAAKGYLDSSSSDLRFLIGRPTVTLSEAVNIGLSKS